MSRVRSASGVVLRRLTTPSYLSQSSALFAAMTTAPTTQRKWLINWTIQQLIAQELWAKLDVLYMLAAATEQAARLNWKNPGTFTCTAVNSPTFTADRGFAGDGSTSYLATGYNAATAGLGFNQNSAHWGMWNRTSAGATQRDLGLLTAGDFLNSRNATDQFTFRINTATLGSISSITDGSGHSLISRTAADLTTAYKAGSSIGTSAGVSAAVSNSELLIGRGETVYSSDQIATVHAGSGLTSGDVAALTPIFNAYMQGVGAA